MQFRTEIPIQKNDFPIDYHSKLLLLGSCFAENMAEKFQYFKFQITKNPFGIIFNAVSLEKLVERIVTKKYFTEKDIFFHNDLWHCYEVHSELSNPDKEAFLNNLNTIIKSTNNQINKLTHCIITFGTSWVYRLRQAQSDNSAIVANCHKVPQKEFTKVLLTAEQNQKSIQNIISLIHSVNPNLKFIFTVSPVRHSKDGFFENNVSKAHLTSAIYKIVNYQLSIANYFPSYEIVMDELRDYRFFEKDMLHPNQLAVDYIWEKFVNSTITNQSQKLMEEIGTIQKALAHKPFNPNAESHKIFLDNLKSKINNLQSQFPFINFE